MQKLSTGVVLACLVLSVGWAQGDKPVQPAPTPILIVDVQHVIETCKEHAALVAGLKAQADAKQKQFEGEVKALQAKQKELTEKSPTMRDDKWYEDLRAALLKQGELKALEAFHNVNLQDKVGRGIQDLLFSAKKAAEVIRKQRGAQFVIMSKMSPIKLATEEDFKDELLRRRVLTHDKKSGVDITADVIKRMDAEFVKRQKEQGG
ncbi:MAG: OmpH/Skp family outer membrane protein [Planctomycetota bacterium]|jgi:Skp family chaperone for outer membrane proteins